MALHKFLSTIRAARGALFGRMLESTTSQPTDRRNLLDAATRTADVWLTPDLVKDYDEADFRFIPPDQQKELKLAVEEFRRLTTGLHQVTPEAIAQGADLFARINAILHAHIDEPELSAIVAATQSVPWPDFILWADYELHTDWTGDSAVRITLVLKDDAEIESRAFQAEMSRVEAAYRNALQKAGIDRWPYIHVRTRSESKDHVAGAA